MSLSLLQCHFDTKQICQHSADVTRRTLQSVYITYVGSSYLTENTSQSVLLCGETQDVCWELHTEHTGTLCGQMWRFVDTWRYVLCTDGVTSHQPLHGIMLSIWTLCQKVSGSHPRVLWCMTHTVSSYTDPSVCSTLRRWPATTAVLSRVQV